MQKYLYEDLYKLEDSHWWHIAKRSLVMHFLKNWRLRKAKILDVGCGTGKNLETFKRYGKTFGIDYSPDAIRFCKKRGLNNAVKGNIEKMPFRNQFFDVVTALDVLEHVDDKKALKQVHRILKNDGIFIATVPAFPMLWSKWDEVLYHKRRYTKRHLKTLFEKNNFKVLKISYVYSFLFFPVIIIRTIKSFLNRFLSNQNYYPSDFKLSNKIISATFGKIALFERLFVINGLVPFGTSLFIVAKRSTK